jgi:pimeloyl-ACP methyl ester carboxylesterase
MGKLQSRVLLRALLLAVLLATSGCGSFVAHRLAQAPNTYPDWFAPPAPVLLDFPEAFLTNFPAAFAEVGPPPVRLCYRVVPPGDYHLRFTATNWTKGAKTRHRFTFRADLPGATNGFTAAPRGTVVLLHGFGLDQACLAPWAIRLAQAGWRCVLVDLRGHGDSTGRRIYFGVVETSDLSQLLDEWARRGALAQPVAVLSESYGAAVALRWRTLEPRVTAVVAMAPYAELAPAAENIRREYAGWFPSAWLRWGLEELPAVLEVPAAELNPVTALQRKPVSVLFIAGGEDRIAPVNEVNRLKALAATGSELLILPDASHEALPYNFDALVPSVLDWLEAHAGTAKARAQVEGASNVVKARLKP